MLSAARSSKLFQASLLEYWRLLRPLIHINNNNNNNNYNYNNIFALLPCSQSIACSLHHGPFEDQSRPLQILAWYWIQLVDFIVTIKVTLHCLFVCCFPRLIPYAPSYAVNYRPINQNETIVFLCWRLLKNFNFLFRAIWTIRTLQRILLPLNNITTLQWDVLVESLTLYEICSTTSFNPVKMSY